VDARARDIEKNKTYLRSPKLRLNTDQRFKGEVSLSIREGEFKKKKEKVMDLGIQRNRQTNKRRGLTKAIKLAPVRKRRCQLRTELVPTKPAGGG